MMVQVYSKIDILKSQLICLINFLYSLLTILSPPLDFLNSSPKRDDRLQLWLFKHNAWDRSFVITGENTTYL